MEHVVNRLGGREEFCSSGFQDQPTCVDTDVVQHAEAESR